MVSSATLALDPARSDGDMSAVLVYFIYSSSRTTTRRAFNGCGEGNKQHLIRIARNLVKWEHTEILDAS